MPSRLRLGFLLALLSLGAGWVPLKSQAPPPPPPPPRKGVSGLLSKLSGKPGSAAVEAGVPYTSITGREYLLYNPFKVTADQGREYQKKLDEKCGFRDYRFGMSVEECDAIARKNKERFIRSEDATLQGPDTTSITMAEQQTIAGVPVSIVFGFHKRRFVKVQIRPLFDNTTMEQVDAVYKTFAQAFGPGLNKAIDVSKGHMATTHVEWSELNTEDFVVQGALRAMAKSFRMGDVGTGYFWYSDKVEINLTTGYSPGTLERGMKDRLEVDYRGRKSDFTMSIASKEWLKQLYAQAAATPGKSGI